MLRQYLATKGGWQDPNPPPDILAEITRAANAAPNLVPNWPPAFQQAIERADSRHLPRDEPGLAALIETGVQGGDSLAAVTRAGYLIRREPGRARCIEVLVEPDDLPVVR